jgi:predicted 2-oxoglutarate/Fe(II)-dependent dioxygenase YbiX
MKISIKDSNIEKYDMGIVVFKNIIDMTNYEYILDKISLMKKEALEKDYTIIKNDSGKPLYAINRSGHRYAVDDLEKSCSHIMDFANQNSDERYINFFQMCEDAMYQCLIRYIEFFPMMLPCLWWRTQGHIVAYGPGSNFGTHCDNDINYKPGAEPDQQLAIRNVVGGLIYFNDSVEHEVFSENKRNFVGGKIAFPYANFTYTPRSGDIIMFPSNYLGTHEVEKVIKGERYAYVGYFAQGSNDLSRGVNIRQPSPIMDSGQVWMPSIVEDYIKSVKLRHSDKPKEEYDKLVQACDRQYTSDNTNKELGNKNV